MPAYKNKTHQEPKKRLQETDTTMKEYYTAEEAAHILGVRKGTLTSWRRKGKGPKYLAIRRQVLYPNIFYPATEVDKYLKERERCSTSEVHSKNSTTI
jgi:hypothetical protein